MILQGKQVYLRPLKLSDADGNYPDWLNDPVVCRYNSHGESLYTKKMAYAYIQSVTDNPSAHVFAICLVKNDLHIGNIALQQISTKNQSAEFAILIGESSSYGQGMGYEAGEMLLNYAFNTLNLHRVYCGTHVDNIGMRQLAQKLGMQEEGKRRDAIFKNGQFADIVEYAILDHDYKKRTS